MHNDTLLHRHTRPQYIVSRQLWNRRGWTTRHQQMTSGSFESFMFLSCFESNFRATFIIFSYFYTHATESCEGDLRCNDFRGR